MEYETEEQQVEALKEWWAENGKAVIAGIVLGAGVIGGWTFWKGHQEKQAVIASDTGGNRELVCDGVNGVLVPPGDSQSLSNAMLDYAQDPELRLRHGLASRDRVMSRFTIERMIDDYRSLYENALGMQRA